MPMLDDSLFLLFIVVMTSLAVVLLLALFILMEIKMNRIMDRLDEIANSANKFVKIGLKYFKADK